MSVQVELYIISLPINHMWSYVYAGDIATANHPVSKLNVKVYYVMSQSVE